MCSTRWRPIEVLDKSGIDGDGNSSNESDTRECMERLRDSIRLSYDNIVDSKNVMCFLDDKVFIWQVEDQCVYCCRLKNERHILNIQRLALTNPPLADVEELQFSATGRYLALYGTRGINVLELPRKWGINGAYEGSKSTVLCRSWSIGERFFVCNHKVSLLCSRWHPASQQENHIVILTNDNCLRIYDINDEQTAVQVINLSSSDSSESLTQSISLYSISLGENAVSFDFGSAISKCYDVDPSTITSQDECLWPLYVLRGNGDVLLLYSSLKYSYVSKCIIGPLTMRPPAEDNYGVDACSLLCLDCDPNLIVVVTSSGVIHHCIALNTDEDNSNDRSLLPQPTLFVYESIELSLTLISNMEAQDTSCLIKLHKDPIISTRYFCSHSCGIHAISVPFVAQLKSKDVLSFKEEETVVEHLICTKPFGNETQISGTNNSSPIGLAVGVQNGYTSLLVLLNTGELIGRRLTPIYIPHIIDDENEEIASNDNEVLALLPKVDFDEHITQILKRNSSVPLLKSKDNEFDQSQQLLELMLNTTDVLKKEYLQRFENASLTIERRVKALINDKKIQLNELERCNKEKECLLSDLIQFAEKYDNARQTQEVLSNKIDSILGSLQYQQPILSDAEISLRDELKKISNKLSSHRNKLEQIKVKCKYQEEQISKSEIQAAHHRSNAITSKQMTADSQRSPSLNQIKSIKQMLNNEKESIEELIQSLNGININKNID